MKESILLFSDIAEDEFQEKIFTYSNQEMGWCHSVKGRKRTFYCFLGKLYQKNVMPLYKYLSHYYMGGTLPAGVMFQVFYEITQSLYQLHKQGIIHRNLQISELFICQKNKKAKGDKTEFSIKFATFDRSIELPQDISTVKDCLDLFKSIPPGVVSFEESEGHILSSFEPKNLEELHEVLKKIDMFALGVCFHEICYGSKLTVEDIKNSKYRTKGKVLNKDVDEKLTRFLFHPYPRFRADIDKVLKALNEILTRNFQNQVIRDSLFDRKPTQNAGTHFDNKGSQISTSIVPTDGNYRHMIQPGFGENIGNLDNFSNSSKSCTNSISRKAILYEKARIACVKIQQERNNKGNAQAQKLLEKNMRELLAKQEKAKECREKVLVRLHYFLVHEPDVLLFSQSSKLLQEMAEKLKQKDPNTPKARLLSKYLDFVRAKIDIIFYTKEILNGNFSIIEKKKQEANEMLQNPDSSKNIHFWVIAKILRSCFIPSIERLALASKEHPMAEVTNLLQRELIGAIIYISKVLFFSVNKTCLEHFEKEYKELVLVLKKNPELMELNSEEDQINWQSFFRNIDQLIQMKKEEKTRARIKDFLQVNGLTAFGRFPFNGTSINDPFFDKANSSEEENEDEDFNEESASGLIPETEIKFASVKIIKGADFSELEDDFNFQLEFEKSNGELASFFKKKLFMGPSIYSVNTKKCLKTTKKYQMFEGEVHKVSVVIKRFTKSIFRKQGSKKYFLSLLRKQSKLKSHTNIIDFISYSETNEFFDLALEKCRGGSLLDLLNNEAKMNDLKTEVLIQIAKEINLALVFIHRKEMVHGDISPSKIFFKDKAPEQAKLSFFGTSGFDNSPHLLYADSINSSSEKSSFFASKSLERSEISEEDRIWMPPEVLCGEKPTQKSDIYSFGVILFLFSSQPSQQKVIFFALLSCNFKKLGGSPTANALSSKSSSWLKVENLKIPSNVLSSIGFWCMRSTGLRE